MSKLLQLALVLFAVPAILISIWFRFSNLSTPFWDDEHQTYRVARGIIPETGKPELTQALKNHQDENMLSPPVFNILLHYWLRLNGSVAWARLLPSIIGLASLLCLFLLGKAAGYKSGTNVIGVSLMAASWVFVHYSEEVAVYSPSILATLMLGLGLVNYIKDSNRLAFIYLLFVGLFGALTSYGNWIFLPILGLFFIYDARHSNSFRRLVIFTLSAVLIIGYLSFDYMQYRSNWANAAPYLVPLKLNSVPLQQVPIKLIKDNLDFQTYVFGATPWYLDATFFPTVARFGAFSTIFYYSSLLITLCLLLTAFLFLSFTSSPTTKAIKIRCLPLFLLLMTLLIVNGLSLFGKYPIGPVRQSLFYAPLAIWVFMQLLDLVSRKLSVLTLVIVGAAVMLVINSLTRLYRVPQRHIGLQIEFYNANII